MAIHRLMVLAPLVAVALLVGCQTDRQRLNIGQWERPVEPEGLFPENIDKAKWSATQVTSNFRDSPEKLADDPSLTLRTLVYFEWLANDLKVNYDVDPKQVRKVLDARNDLRSTLRIPPDQGTNESMAQLNSMSKFLAAAVQGATKNDEAPEVADRRRLLVKTRGQVSKLLEQSLEARAAAGTTN